MSQPQIKIPRELRLDIEALAAEAGASVTFEPSGAGHWRATITRNGSSRFIVISCTPKDAHSFTRAVLADARRELRKLDYVKPKAEWECSDPPSRDDAACHGHGRLHPRASASTIANGCAPIPMST